MKLSISLSDEDVDLIDEIVAEGREPGRSAVIRRAVDLLRETRLTEEYELAAKEWETSGEDAVWSATDAEGLGDETW